LKIEESVFYVWNESSTPIITVNVLVETITAIREASNIVIDQETDAKFRALVANWRFESPLRYK
jgi:hypothetical protein